MGVFLYACKKHGSIKKTILDKLSKNEFYNALHIEYNDMQVKFSSDNSSVLINYARDTVLYSYAEQFYADENGGACAFQGNAIISSSTVGTHDFVGAKEAYEISREHGAKGIKEEFEGDYSLVHMLSNGDAYAVNDDLSVEHIYYIDSSGYIIVTNRIRFVKVLIPSISVDIESLNMISCIGSLVGTETSLMGVKRLEQGSWLEIKKGKLSLCGNPLFFTDKEDISERIEHDFDKYYDELMVTPFNRISAALNRCKDFSLALSGGKDSRQILGMIISAGYLDKITCFTNGYSEHPDMVVASMLAEHFGIKQKKNFVDMNSEEPEYDPRALLKKIMGSIFQTDGCFGNFDARGGIRPMNTLAMPGHVNEIFKGFIKPSINIKKYSDCINYYSNIHQYDQIGMLNSNGLKLIQKKFTARCNKLRDSNISPLDATNLYFMADRLPNWAGYTIRIDGYSQTFMHLLNGTKFAKTAYALGVEQLGMQRFHFESMKRADKFLVECPFAMQNWSSALGKYADGLKIDSAAIPMPKDIPMFGSWQHTINNDSSFRLMLYDIVSSYHDSPIWSYYNRDVIEKALLFNTFSYIPLINIYGFLTVFFYLHSIELPQKLVLPGDAGKNIAYDMKLKPYESNIIYRCGIDAKLTPYKTYNDLKASDIFEYATVQVSQAGVKHVTNCPYSKEIDKKLKKTARIASLKKELQETKVNV